MLFILCSQVVCVFVKSEKQKSRLLTWDVGQHDDDQTVVVVERDVVLVGQPHGVHPRPAHEGQSGVDGHQLADDSQWVQDDEEVVSAEGKETGGGGLAAYSETGTSAVDFFNTYTHTHTQTCFSVARHAQLTLQRGFNGQIHDACTQSLLFRPTLNDSFRLSGGSS